MSRANVSMVEAERPYSFAARKLDETATAARCWAGDSRPTLWSASQSDAEPPSVHNRSIGTPGALEATVLIKIKAETPMCR
jgi:hypothetical protein